MSCHAGGTLSGDLPGYSVVWCPRQHSHTSQPNIIESSQVTQEEGGESKEEEEKRFIQHNISNTPTCPSTPTPTCPNTPTICDVMCHPDQASMKNCRYQNGSLPPVGKPPKPETIVVIKPLSLSEKSLVFGEQERPQRCGDQNRYEEGRVVGDTVQNRSAKQVTREGNNI